MMKRDILVFLIIIIVVSFIFIGINLQYRKPVKTSHRYAVILNFTNDFPQETDVPAHPGQALQAYWTIKNYNVSDENIYLFLKLETLDYIDYNMDYVNDLNGVQIDYKDDEITWNNVNHVFNELANILTVDDELVIYVSSHGYFMNSTLAAIHGDGFNIYENEFKDMIDKIHVRKMVLIFDFCYAGNFASRLDAPNRIIISAVSDNEETWCYWYWGDYLLYHNMTNALENFGSCGTVFSHPFWKSILENNTLIDAFNYANQTFREWATIAPTSKYIVNKMHPIIRIGENITSLLNLYDAEYK